MPRNRKRKLKIKRKSEWEAFLDQLTLNGEAILNTSNIKNYGFLLGRLPVKIVKINQTRIIQLTTPVEVRKTQSKIIIYLPEIT